MRAAVLSGYRPWAYFGFASGTVYQYALLKSVVTIVFKDFEDMPEYHFDVPVMFITLAAFAILYEAVMFMYTKQSVKEIMLD